MFLINLLRTSQEKGGDFFINMAFCYSLRLLGFIVFLVMQRAEWLFTSLLVEQTETETEVACKENY